MKSVYVGMSADILHHGHIALIKKASKLGKVTIGLLTDKAISSYKQPPIMTYKERYAVISQIKGVFNVVPQHSLDYSANLRRYRPDIVVHASNWRSDIQAPQREKVLQLLERLGGRLVEFSYTKGISSSIIKERIRRG